MIDIVDKFNMVDMGGIDIVESQGVAVEGLFNMLLSAIQNCRYQILYNWKFAKIEIAPSYVELVFDGTRISINGAVAVTEDDVVHVYSLEPEPIVPVIEELIIDTNGTYNAPEGIDGYNPVIVSVDGNKTYEGTDPPTSSLGSDGDWYIQEGYRCGRINSLGFDTGVRADSVYGFRFEFMPYRGVSSYQSYLLATLDQFTLGRTGDVNRCYLRVRGSEAAIFTIAELSVIEAKNGVITYPGGSAAYDSSLPLQSQVANIFIGAKEASRYSDFLFKSLALYDTNFDTIQEFVYDYDSNSVKTNGVDLSPVGTGSITRYNTGKVYRKENGTWIEY